MISRHASPLSDPRDPRFLAIFLAVLLALMDSGAAFAADKSKESAEVRVSKSVTNEAYDRGVDEVALASQQKAVDKLNVLLKKYRGTRQEPILLSRLGDIQQQAASILFRISHGASAHGKGAAAQSRYSKGVQQTIKTFSELIAKYPSFEDIPHAYFVRGKSYEDIGDKEKATKDYLYLVKNYPITSESLSAYMSLAEFAIQANDHPRAITYLKEVEKHEDSPHYPFALYKLAWSYYNLKNVPAALSYAERQIAFYNARGAKEGADVTSDAALKENTLLDLAVFYFEGYEQKLEAYALSTALPYFKKIESGPTLGKMLLRYAKLLRSHSHEADLVKWKNEVLANESARPESLDIVLTAFEYQLNKREYPQILESTQDIVKLYPKAKGWESMPRAQKFVLDTAEGLQQLIIKNKDASEVRKYSEILASIYDSFTKIVDESDARIPRVHYNLAETLFAIKDYAGATENYRWIVTHWKPKNTKDTTVSDAGLKAIACRYEVLRDKKLIPTELKAVPPGKEPSRSIEPLLAEWLDWIDTQFKGSKAEKPDKTTENFLFESARALYGQGYVDRAVERMRELIQRNPKSPYAIPSASLILDTAIASEDWEKVHELATQFRKVPEWAKKDEAFSKRLYAVAADAYYKQIEKKSRANDPRAVMKLTEKFVELYPESKRYSDAMVLAGSAAQATASPKQAIEYYTHIIEKSGSDKGEHALDNLAAALASRAQLLEDQYLLERAKDDYKALLGLPQAKLSEKLRLSEDKANELRRKTLAMTWLTGNEGALRAAIGDTKLCNAELASDCEKYSALLAINDARSTSDSDFIKSAFDKSRKDSTGSKDLRALWAAVALEGSKTLAFRDRNNALKILAKGWEGLDPLVRFTLIPKISASVPKAFELNRLAMKDVAPLKADEKYITHRVDMIREMENAATAAMKLPWSRVRAQVLNEVAGLYSDLAHGLRDLPPPKGLSDAELNAYNETIQKLVLPFEEKGQDVRGKSFEIASRFSVEDEVFNKIADPYFAENPSTAKKIKLAQPIPESKLFDLATLELLDPKGDWGFLHKTKPTEPEERVGRLKVLWARAIRERKWHQVGFYLQEAQEKALIPAGPMGLIKAISLASVGARGEAVAEIEQSRKDLGPAGNTSVTTHLLQMALRSCNRERVATFLKELQDEQNAQKESPSKQQAFLQTTAKTYIQ